MNRPILIGICGGTGSGKSTVAKAIFESLPEKNISIIEQDAYYRDQTHLSLEERVKTNYDHPLAFDTDLLVEHMATLLTGKSIEKPNYNFSNHTRETFTTTIEAKDIIILEGIMILEEKKLLNLFN